MSMKRGMCKTLLSLGIGAVVFPSWGIQWATDAANNSSWNDPANWAEGEVPDASSTVTFGWKSATKPASPYTINLDAPQRIEKLQLNEWIDFPSPLHIGTSRDRLFGNTLSLLNVERCDYIGGSSVIGVDVILTGDSTWKVQKGYNGDMTVEGSISGPYSLTMDALENGKDRHPGTLIFVARNTYTGTTTVSMGTLRLGNGTDASRGSGVAGDIVNNATLEVDPARGDFQTIGNLSGTGNFVKKGLGTAVFAGTESLSCEGAFRCEQHVWSDYGLGPIDCVVPNGVFNFSSYTLKYSFNFLGSENLDWGMGPVTLSDNDISIGVLKNTLTIGGAISGGKKFTKGGRGTMVLKSASTYTGGTSVNGGVMRLESAATFGTGAVNVEPEATVVLAAAEAAADRIPDASALTLAGGLVQDDDAMETVGALTLKAGPVVIKVTDGQSTSGFTFASLASRAVGNTTVFDLAGDSSVIFTAATAGEVIPGAILKRGNAVSFATTDASGAVVPFVADDATDVKMDLFGDVSLPEGSYGTLELCNNSGSAVTVTLGGALTTANGLLLSGSSPIVVTGGSIAGNEAKDAIILVANAGGVTLETPVSSDNITFGGVGDLAIKGNLTAADSAKGYINVNVDGNITWAQKNANCGAVRFFRGRTTFAEGARLYEGNSNSSGGNSYLRVGLGTVVDFNGVSAKVNGLTGMGEVTNSSETPCTLTCDWQPAGSNYVNPYNPNFEGNLTGNLSLSVTSDGYYRDRYNQSLTGENAFTGNLSVGGGAMLSLGNQKSLGSSTLYMNGGRLDSQGVAAVACTDGYLKSFTFRGSASLDLSSGTAHLNAAAVTLTVDANTLTLGALVEETAGSALTKAGAGTLELNGDALYTGVTTVSGGTLRLNGVVASQELSVASGATLGFVSTTELHKKASLTIEDGGSLNLKNSAPVTVKRLFVAGVEQTETGTYGAVGSGARHELACISGPGLLKVGGSGMMVIIK